MIDALTLPELNALVAELLVIASALLATSFGTWLYVKHTVHNKKASNSLRTLTVVLAVIALALIILRVLPQSSVKDSTPSEPPPITTTPETTAPPDTTTPPETTAPPEATTPPETTGGSPETSTSPVRFDLEVDTPSVAAAGGKRVGSTRFQLDDWGNDGPLVQVSPAWVAYSSDNTEVTERTCDIVIRVEGPEDFGPWYSSKCTKSNHWNGFGDAGEAGVSEISLPGTYALTVTDDKSGASGSLDFDVYE